MHRTISLLLSLSVLGACSSEPVAPVDVAPVGPPEVVTADVRRHAEQFNRDLSRRPAGSQQEFAAATYLLGHLQRAGYVVQLDYVPVKDLVRSTNVVAEPPSGRPRLIVVIAYDGDANGAGIGLFLEVARALRVRVRRHPVEFVALGAEGADVSGGLLGSRRLARRLLDDGLRPTIVELAAIGKDEPLTVTGDVADGFIDIAGLGVAAGAGSDLVWDRAGFPHVIVSGDAAEVGAALLEYLEEAAG
jgi:hypothetical protein